MRTQTTPSLSPDFRGGNGMAVARDARASGRPAKPSPTHRAETSNDHNHNTESDSYDDGLVHGHLWAMSSTVR